MNTNTETFANTSVETPHLVLCEVGNPGIDGMESYSPYCLKVSRALGIAGLPFERRHGARPRDFIELNPVGQVPVLLIDGVAVADSTEICHRLDELAAGALVPPSAAEAWLWEEFADTAVGGFVVASRWADDGNFGRLAKVFFAGMPEAMVAQIHADVIDALIARDLWRAGPQRCWLRFGRLLDQLEDRAPETGYWLGAVPSVADAALYGQLRSLDCDLTPWQASELRRRGRLMAYLSRVDAVSRPRVD